MAGYATMDELFKTELAQMADEGAAVDRDAWLRLLEAAHGAPDEIEALYDELAALPTDKKAEAREPNDLDAIRALRPDGPRRMGLPYGEGELLERLHGAWLGRCCGCALGKPFESAPFFHVPGKSAPSSRGPSQRAACEAYLRAAGAWPLDFYLPGAAPAAELAKEDLAAAGLRPDMFKAPGADGMIRLNCERSHRENIKCMETDDDIRYTLIGLLVAEKNGPAWTTADMGKTWLTHLTFMQVCTAETQAYINMVNTEGARKGNGLKKADWLRIASWRNPYREWIGAQIRADHFGYAAAGHPELAAEFAWRDARVSHVRNGIYGEMFIAAAIAAAFATNDTREIIRIGLSEIPGDCRLARAIRETVAEYDRRHDWAAAWDWFRFDSPWGAMDPVHTIPNAIVVVLGLLAGAGDFQRTIIQAVLGGFDTDCNGATAGSIIGAQFGAAGVPQKWSAPLHDTIDTAMPAFGRISIRALAERSLAIWRAANKP